MVILHYHLRPGGVRRVIELAAPYLVREMKSVRRVVIASGERPEVGWEKVIRKALAPLPVEFFIDASFGYLTDQRGTISQILRNVRNGLAKLLGNMDQNGPLVWAHNLGIGRNLILTNELSKACAQKRISLLLHHHDWWFDNRWSHWPQMRRAGFPSLKSVANVIFAAEAKIQHITINRADQRILSRHSKSRSHWLPNLIDRSPKPAPSRVRKAREWLEEIIGERNPSIWLMPCRALRRKNIAEAILLAKWLRPDGWLVTTGGPSSENERDYFAELSAKVKEHRWRVKLGVLQGDESRKPPVGDLMAASEAVVLTSIQEGFGLPFLEAAAAGRPLIARSLPNIAPDLAQFGFKFAQYYDDIVIDPTLFDWDAEHTRQMDLYRTWHNQLPAPVRHFAGEPWLLQSDQRRAIPFSRMTLSAQLEVLEKPVEQSFLLCLRLNPFLKTWRKRSQNGTLKPSKWPSGADRKLGGLAYAAHFSRIWSESKKAGEGEKHGPAAQRDFLRLKLKSQNLFPLLWSTRT